MQVKVTKVAKDTKCNREVRLSPAGVPIYCTSKAVMAINGMALCQKHAQEAMAIIGVK
jgi:DNA-binding phage protein